MKRRRQKTDAAAGKFIYPARINKYLAHHGYATRRGADELIVKRLVTINGRQAVLGDAVREGDTVLVARHGTRKPYVYIAYHKPIGTVTHSPQRGEKGVRETFPIPDMFPVGRLDKDSHGLLILTNDGRVTDRLLHPDRSHEKEYVVRTVMPLRPSFAKHMAAGVAIGGYVTKRAKVTVTGGQSFAIILTEGKRHQVRRMCSALHVEVRELTRTRVLNIRLGKLKPGEYRVIDGSERKEFLRLIGLSQVPEQGA